MNRGDDPAGRRPADPPGSDFEPPSAAAARTPAYTLAERLLIRLCLLLFSAMIVATLAQILFRYVLQLPLPWTEEAARALFVLSMVMSMAFAYREREHIVVDFLFDQMPAPVRRWLGFVFDVAIIGFLVFWARGAWRLAELTWNSRLITISFFRVGYFYAWEVAAIALLLLYVLLDMARRARGGRGA